MKKVSILLLLMVCLLSACSKDPRSICKKHLKEIEDDSFIVYHPEKIEDKKAPDLEHFSYRLIPQIVYSKENSEYNFKMYVDYYDSKILHLNSIGISRTSFDLNYMTTGEVNGEYIGNYSLKVDDAVINALSEMVKKNSDTIQIISEEETHDFVLTPEMIKQFRYVLDAYKQIEKLEV